MEAPSVSTMFSNGQAAAVAVMTSRLPARSVLEVEQLTCLFMISVGAETHQARTTFHDLLRLPC